MPTVKDRRDKLLEENLDLLEIPFKVHKGAGSPYFSYEYKMVFSLFGEDKSRIVTNHIYDYDPLYKPLAQLCEMYRDLESKIQRIVKNNHDLKRDIAEIQGKLQKYEYGEEVRNRQKNSLKSNEVKDSSSV